MKKNGFSGQDETDSCRCAAYINHYITDLSAPAADKKLMKLISYGIGGA